MVVGLVVRFIGIGYSIMIMETIIITSDYDKNRKHYTATADRLNPGVIVCMGMVKVV